jgi:hypothetical protein
MIMAARQGSGPVPDLYQVLGVSREASGGEITRAWRQRALAEHPDRKPRDAAAPARFGALAKAYRVLGDPARRAAYDRSLTDRAAGMPQGPAAHAPRGGISVPVTVRPARGVAEPPLRAGPVWVDIPPSAPADARTAEDEMVRLAALAALAELAVLYLAGGRGWPW